jgi:hypothetical protein
MRLEKQAVDGAAAHTASTSVRVCVCVCVCRLGDAGQRLVTVLGYLRAPRSSSGGGETAFQVRNAFLFLSFCLVLKTMKLPIHARDKIN